MRCSGLVVLLLAAGGWASGQDAPGLPPVTEGSLVYRSAASGTYDFVPLEHTKVAIDVRGLVASTTVTQRYTNRSDGPIEAVYAFPLPHDGSVYDLEVVVGQRRIRSVIREREEAKRTYEAAKAEGKRAALLEEERPNIFTASVANVMPDDRIEVRIRYVQPLAWEDGRVRLVFPMVVGPRYIPGAAPGTAPETAPGTASDREPATGWAQDTDQVPDASRVTPPVRALESRPGHDIAVEVRLEAGVPLATLGSPSHKIVVENAAEGIRKVSLAAEKELPNRDFVLEFARAASRSARTALFLSPKPEGGESHFMLVAYPPSLLAEEERPPLEMLFLIDVSGSMEGASIQQARTALLQGLDRLRARDRFGVVAFDNRIFDFRPGPLPATAENLEAGRRFVRGLRAGGGTEMLPALEHLMAQPTTPGYLRTIVLLTDGCLGNEEQIFAALKQRLGEARLFTVAIGSAPNHFLAAKMAQYGRGTFSHIADGTEIVPQMARLLDQIESPVVTDLQLRISGVDAQDILPTRLPDLFMAQPLVIHGRLAGRGAGIAHLEGRAGPAAWQQEIPFDTERAAFHPGITTLWARQRIEGRLEAWREAAGAEDKERLRQEIVGDAVRYRLVTRFTSLVAVEDLVVNPGGDSGLAVVETELPAGWDREKVFGNNPVGGTADAFLEALALLLCALGLAAGLLSESVRQRFLARVRA